MNKRLDPELMDPDNPEWTEKTAHRAVRFKALPQSLQGKLARAPRGLQKTPTKVATTIRLSPEVMEAFKATGAGWQTRIDAALKDWLKNHSPA